jgi:hypothetical protein
MFRSIVLLVGGLALLSAVSLSAQEDAVLGQRYGSGVHAYFAGELRMAHRQLTSAIDGGSKDPRVFYFRGLTYLKLGRPQEAAVDFRKGAEFESKDINRFYAVGKALERVQGATRLELETYRVDARMAALADAEKNRKARYEAIQREEDRVLREQALAAPVEPIKTPPPAAQPSAEESNPFAVPGGAAPAEKPAEKTPKAEKPSAEKAPAKPEKPAEKEPDADNPFLKK